MVPELPTLNRCPHCHSANAIYKCVVQDGVLTFMLRPACPDCGFTTEDVFVTETRAAAAWNAIVPEKREPEAEPARIPRMRDELESDDPAERRGSIDPGAGMSSERLAEIEAAGDPADIPELVAEIRRLRGE